LAKRKPKPEGVFDAHVTAGICVLACGVTLMAWMGKDVSPLYLTHAAFFRQPWRILTCVLPHANPRTDGFVALFHILFNVTMILRFGRVIEERYGALLTALFYVVVAAGSGVAQYVFDAGGIGLSGVGYGVFGFLWVAGRRSREFEGSMDYGTELTFVGWFFFCVVASHAGVLRIGNVAHGTGALLGGLIAIFATAKSAGARVASAAAVAAFIAAVFVLASRFDLLPFGAQQAILQIRRF
jgi:membrane associated rhomboid family serine protease